MPGYNRQRPGKTKGYAYTGKTKMKGKKMKSYSSHNPGY